MKKIVSAAIASSMALSLMAPMVASAHEEEGMKLMADRVKPTLTCDERAGKFGAEGLLQAGANRTSFKELTSLDGVAGQLLKTIEAERITVA